MPTIKQMIEQLKEYPEDTIVTAYDADAELVVEITGYLYDPERKTLEICTDDPR